MTKPELADLKTKADLLEDAGFRYNFDREMYVNQIAKKAFSMSYIEDHPLSDVERCISAPVDGTTWHFYFNVDPAPSVRRQLELVLN